MAKKKGGSLGNALMGLHPVVRFILALFFDCVYGVARFIDGIFERNVVKIIVGFLWIFYGLVIGWILDIIFTLLKKRPLML